MRSLSATNTRLAVTSEIECEELELQAAENFPDSFDARKFYDMDGEIFELEDRVGFASW
jgi:hypothetical protein